MANRIKNHLTNKINRRTPLDAPAVNYRSETLSSNTLKTKNAVNVDDVIVSLANAYENRRARQATEWERMGRQNVQILL